MKPIAKAKKTNTLPESGTKLKIKKRLRYKTPSDCKGFFVKLQHLECRRPNEKAEYIGYVPGAGGDLWWIKHRDGTIGAYEFDEITDI